MLSLKELKDAKEQILDCDDCDEVDDVIDDSDNEIDEIDEPITDRESVAHTPLICESPGQLRLRPSNFHGLPSTLFIEYPSEVHIKRTDKSVCESINGRVMRYRCAWERYCLRHTFQQNCIKKSEKNWTVSWGKHLSSDDYKSLNPLQKVNHFPASWCLGRKDRLSRTLSTMKRLNHAEFNYHPDTYVLPMDKDSLLRRFSKQSDSKTDLFIVKPVASSCGRGIKVKTQEDIRKSLLKPTSKSLLVQKYLKNPYLIDGKKFDLRVYVLVTGVDPMRVYVCQEGLTRLSTSDYTLSNIKNRFSHLTNYSVNKKAAEFKASSVISASETPLPPDTDSVSAFLPTNIVDDSAMSGTDGYKWSLSAFKTWLSQRESPEIAENTFSKIFDICVKTMIAAESELTSKMHSSVGYRSNCFELFGCDVILDHKLEPHLLEVNVSPSLMGSSPLDRRIKGMLIADVLHIVGVYPHDEKIMTKTENEYNDCNFKFVSCSKLLSSQDHWRRNPSIANVDFANLLSGQESATLWSTILMIDTEISRSNSTMFKCLHPNPATVVRYNQLYRHQRFLDHVLGHWVMSGRSNGRYKTLIPSNFKPISDLSRDESCKSDSSTDGLSSIESTPKCLDAKLNSWTKSLPVTPNALKPSPSFQRRQLSLREQLLRAVDGARITSPTLNPNIRLDPTMT